jgi:hypothetical protein
MEWRSVEVRWFYPGPCPPEVADWFRESEGPGEPEARTDEYARLGRDDLGIKRRGGEQLDVKVRTDRPGVALPAGLEGHVEGWTKWSLPLDPTRPSELSWLPVEKLRWSRRYRVGNGEAEPIPSDELVPAGCTAELAFIRIGLVEAWTFGLEAFNTAGDAVGSLTAGAGAFICDSPLGPITFELEDSCGYPAWLGRLR